MARLRIILGSMEFGRHRLVQPQAVSCLRISKHSLGAGARPGGARIVTIIIGAICDRGHNSVTRSRAKIPGHHFVTPVAVSAKFIPLVG